MPLKNGIKKSVGEGGVNQPQDVATVQYLLNLTSERRKVPKKTIAVDGKVGPETIGAIREYQTKFCKVVDGKVDPEQETIKRLNQTTPLYSANDGESYLRRHRDGRVA